MVILQHRLCHRINFIQKKKTGHITIHAFALTVRTVKKITIAVGSNGSNICFINVFTPSCHHKTKPSRQLKIQLMKFVELK